MSVVLEFLGTGDAFASGGRFHSCALVRAPDGLLLVDCGASAPVALQRRGLAPDELGAILLTHFHGDHFAGVPLLLLDAAFNRPRKTRLTIAGPEGVQSATERALDALFPGTLPRVKEAVPVSFVELPPLTPVRIGSTEVTAYPVTHSSGVASQALRVAIADTVLAFSSDTEWDAHLVDVSRGADVFVCECTAYREAVPGHLSLEQLRAHAPELGAKRIVLNHLGREMLQHAAESPWECAEDGMVIGVGAGPEGGRSRTGGGSEPDRRGRIPSDPGQDSV